MNMWITGGFEKVPDQETSASHQLIPQIRARDSELVRFSSRRRDAHIYLPVDSVNNTNDSEETFLIDKRLNGSALRVENCQMLSCCGDR